MITDERPRDETRASETGQSHASVPRTGDIHVEAVLDEIMLGRASLRDLPAPVFTAWCYGFESGKEAGAASRQAEVDRLSAEADHWYLVANNKPAEVKRITRDRIDAALAEHAEAWLAGDAA